MEQIMVFRGPFIDVSMAKEVLENNGIPCLMRSEHGERFILRTGGLLEDYFLYVSREEEEKARELLQSIGK